MVYERVKREIGMSFEVLYWKINVFNRYVYLVKFGYVCVGQWQNICLVVVVWGLNLFICYFFLCIIIKNYGVLNYLCFNFIILQEYGIVV